MQKKLPVYQFVMEDLPDQGVIANSFVEDPAHGLAFVAFSKQAPEGVKFSIDTKKRNVTGVLIQADKKIYRNDPIRGEHYVFFSKSDVESIIKNFSKNLRFGNVTLGHVAPVDGVYMTESWQVGNPDKAQALDIQANEGDWAGTYHVEDEETWAGVEDGTFKGFSIEGLFSRKLVEMAKEEPVITDEKEFWAMVESDVLTDEQKLAEIEKIIAHGK